MRTALEQTDPMRTTIEQLTRGEFQLTKMKHKFEQTRICVFKLEEGVMLWLKITPTC